jgi:Cu+-exporting ATPase
MMTKDPVCGMEVDEKTASQTSTAGDHTYYFCSDACKTRFDKEPEKFASSGPTHG